MKLFPAEQKAIDAALIAWINENNVPFATDSRAYRQLFLTVESMVETIGRQRQKQRQKQKPTPNP